MLINADRSSPRKCRCRSDHCGRSVFAIHEKCDKPTHVVYMLTTDTFVHSQKSLFTSHCSAEAKLLIHVVECHPGLHKTTKYLILDVSVVRKCVSGNSINDVAAFQ